MEKGGLEGDVRRWKKKDGVGNRERKQARRDGKRRVEWRLEG